jgi:hypothetical protein
LQQRLGARPEKEHEVHLGDGVAPFVARLLAAFAEEGGTLFYPRWVPGGFIPVYLITWGMEGGRSCTTGELKGWLQFLSSKLLSVIPMSSDLGLRGSLSLALKEAACSKKAAMLWLSELVCLLLNMVWETCT